jgi:hypothetical protein
MGFTCSSNRESAWRAIPTNSDQSNAADAFISFKAATADAVKHAFDPFSQYWIARIDGRAMHYRPGKPLVNLSANETPPD